MKSLWLLLPLAAVWLVSYVYHLVGGQEVIMDAWWGFPFQITLVSAVMGSIFLAAFRLFAK